MSDSNQNSRRAFLRNAALASGALAATAASREAAAVTTPGRRPNILMICSDQFRTDFVGANGENPSVKTPNLDALVARGTNFKKAVCNQPLCSPSRASFLAGVYATKAKVWRLGLELDHSIPSIATTLKSSGYETAFIGKWHVSGEEEGSNTKSGKGWVAPGPSRAGFDYWEGANVLELTSGPYGGSYWDNSGKDLNFSGEYRVDWMAGRMERWLDQKHDKPWLCFFSILEPHQQNPRSKTDVEAMVPPKRYENTYEDPFVPQDLRDLPGNWRSHLPGYYGCVQAVDDAVGRVVKKLEATGQLENTVIVFFSDHGCHFHTRMGEYKRTPHDAAIRVPLIFAGPGFDNSVQCDEVVSLIDMTATLIEATGTQVPSTMQGKSLMKLPTDKDARKSWDNTAYYEISASMTARGIRTKDWTYACYDPSASPNKDERGTNYIDYCLYNTSADPYQKSNLIGRPEYREICKELREETKKRIIANGEPAPKIEAQKYYV